MKLQKKLSPFKISEMKPAVTEGVSQLALKSMEKPWSQGKFNDALIGTSFLSHMPPVNSKLLSLCWNFLTSERISIVPRNMVARFSCCSVSIFWMVNAKSSVIWGEFFSLSYIFFPLLGGQSILDGNWRGQRWNWRSLLGWRKLSSSVPVSDRAILKDWSFPAMSVYCEKPHLTLAFFG